MFKENFHTHSTYCDGNDSLEEMAEAAIDKGFTALGYSGHSYLDFACDWCMSPKDTEKYIKEIIQLKEKYADKINIYCGTEIDCYSNIDNSKYDFTIGSVHYIKEENDYLPVDESIEKQQEAADKYYSGSLIEYAVKYFEIESNVLEMTNADIIGHFDLVTKFNENDKYFSTKDERYIAAWKKAVDKLISYSKPFEINTGAIARGKRVTPYPAMDIAEYINSKGGYFIVTSDCHNREMLDCKFEETYNMYSKFKIISFDEYLKGKK